MIIIMKRGHTLEQREDVIKRIREEGLDVHLSVGEDTTIIGVIGVPITETLKSAIESRDAVEQVFRVTKRYKLASREFHPEPTVIDLGDGVKIGGEEVVIMAGPCSVESEEQLMQVAAEVSAAGAKILRGGAFKPRTSPYEFRGLYEDGLKILAQARDAYGLKIITEVMTPSDVELVGRYTDIFQIGARNCQNYQLLEEVGRSGKPVMLKRGMAVQYEEWLLLAEYILAQGNPDVMLCERGIRSFETYTRNVFDLTAVPVVKHLSHLPVIADPSHGTGHWHLIPAMSRAAVAAGADGLMIEVHHDPSHAMSDGAQSLKPERFRALLPELQVIAGAIGRTLAPVREPIAAD
ncbi:MAG TPA: 3-deoxy-7-phosphoheptulonate synthase [Thermomicrobiales bacterium]|nr:3-deoxy-7-phosphoheptulonate synthase [Thermomicrobiales bacterium]